MSEKRRAPLQQHQWVLMKSSRNTQSVGIREPILQGAPTAASLSWLPPPMLLIATLSVWALGPLTAFESFGMMAANSFLGYTVFGAVAAALIGRSFLEQKRPSLLLMGCGALIWSCSGAVTTLDGLRLLRGTVDLNSVITMHNCCVWVASFCHLAGVGLTLNWRVSPQRPWVVLALAYALAVTTAGIVVLAAFSGWLPTFFIPGQGGTLVRHFVLSSTVGMLALTAVILVRLNSAASPYLHWYIHALMLLAVGTAAILLQKVNGDCIGWIGRGAQSLGGLYLVVAALLSRDKPLTEGISLWEALIEMRQNRAVSIAIAAALISLGAAGRLLFLSFLGARFPFATFYPAVLLAAAYGGLWPGLAATGLSVAMVFWIRIGADIPIGANNFLILRVAYFVLVGIGLSWICKGIHQLQKRAIEAEAEACYALERAVTAEKLRETESRLRQSEQSFTTFVNTANEGVWVLETEGTTSYLNKRLAQILGRPKSEVIGRPAHEFVCPEDRPLFLQQLEILRRGSVSRYELRIPCMDGSVTWLHVSSAPLFDEEQRVRGSFAMCTDITSRKKMEEELLELNSHLEQGVSKRAAELMRLNGELESFCYSISHELRAPIARLDAFSRLVQEAVAEGSSEELPYLSERIGVASRKMRVVIDSLLLVNRLSRNELHQEPVDLSQMARSIVGELSDEAPGPKVQLHIEPDLVAFGDRAMLNICLRNLLENAFKYSRSKDAVSIRFGFQRSSGAYFIRDRGTGFDMDFRHRLFEPFSRLHPDVEFEGTGMGLAIVKRIVERHGGTVWAEGRPGKGASFFFTLAEGRCGNWYGLTGGADEQAVTLAG